MSCFLQVLFGFFGGIFGGMGMGGGTLLIPLLVIFLNLNQQMAQGINLVSFLVMAIFSILIHKRHNLIEFKVILPVVCGGVLFSVLGAFLAGYIPNEVLKIIFGAFLCTLGIIQFFKIFIVSKKKKISQNKVINDSEK